MVKTLYYSLKINLCIPEGIEDRNIEKNDDVLFHDLEGEYTQMNMKEEEGKIPF